MALLGDSINHLVANAAECFAAQAGEEWSRDADGAGGVTVLNAGFALPARLAALSRYNGARSAAARAAHMQRMRLHAQCIRARARKP